MDDKPHDLERLIFFSDAVIAIMLTLLALELPVPDVDNPAELGPALAEHASNYIAFLISFAVIAATWVAHHMLFTHVVRADAALRTLNLLALLGYVLIPWASKTLGEAGHGAGVLVYSAAMAFLGATTLAVLRHVTRAGLVSERAPASVLSGIRAWSTTTTIMFALSIPASLFAGPVGHDRLALRLPGPAGRIGDLLP